MAEEKSSSRSQQVMALLGFGLAAWLLWGLWQGRYPAIWGTNNDGPPGGVRQVGWLGPHRSPLPWVRFSPYGPMNDAYPVGVALDGLNPDQDSGRRPVVVPLTPVTVMAPVADLAPQNEIAPALSTILPPVELNLPQPDPVPIPPATPGV